MYGQSIYGKLIYTLTSFLLKLVSSVYISNDEVAI